MYLQAIILISILLGILQAPVNMVVDFLFQDIIEAPLADEFKVQVQAQEVRRRVGGKISTVAAHAKEILINSTILENPKPNDIDNKISIARSMSFMEHFTVADATSRRFPPALIQSYVSTSMLLNGAFGDMTGTLSPSRVHSDGLPFGRSEVTDVHMFQDAAERGNIISGLDPSSFKEFHSRLLKQCEQLEGIEKQEFLQRWGLWNESHGDVSSGMSSMFRNIFSSKRSGQDCSRKELLEKALAEVTEFSEDKIRELQIATDVQIGLEIMHCFIIDLLG